MIIDDIYNELKNDDIVKNAFEFSTKFLNKNKSYYSVIKTRQQLPNLETMLYLDEMLNETADFYSKYNYPHFKRKNKRINELIHQLHQHTKFQNFLNKLKKNVLAN